MPQFDIMTGSDVDSVLICLGGDRQRNVELRSKGTQRRPGGLHAARYLVCFSPCDRTAKDMLGHRWQTNGLLASLRLENAIVPRQDASQAETGEKLGR